MQGEKRGHLAILFTRSTLHQDQSPVSSLNLPLEVCNPQSDAANFLREGRCGLESVTHENHEDPLDLGYGLELIPLHC